MKKKLLCLLLAAAAALQLGACSMLEKEYVSIHDYMPSEQEPNITGGRLTVHSASALKLALLSMTYEGLTEGSIIFDPAYEGDAAEDLENACWAVRTEDALCAYCVENISYDFNKIVTINEADIRISYSKVSVSPKQIVHLGFSSEAETAILNALQNGRRTLALLVGRSGFSAEDMAAQVIKAYRDNPTVVPKRPQAIVNVFSGAGTQRLYEIQIDYGVTALELARCRKQLELFKPFAELDRPNASEVERAYVACRYLVENCRILDDDSTEEANSAYTALIERRADSEGLAFGYVELCRQLDVDCRIVYGQHDWQEHCWNIVRIDDSYYHVDITQCAKGGPALGFMQNDETFWGMYRWDVAAYPKCTGTNSFFDFFPPSMIDSLAAASESTDKEG
ncbi:MAG: hypothetical protein IKI39_00870 [Oscillospiraceae bacterium]|nr:hypothetical protein [Oscillospiraceae bacterium]